MPGRASTVLAIDTATEACSVAVLHGDQLTELVETVGHKHSERALPMIDAALVKAGLVLADIDVFAFGAGPGSFTGLRIACGIAQGLAYGKRRQIVPVGNLRALAAGAFSKVADGNLLLAGIDARMNEAYCAIYRRDPHVSEIRAPALERPQSLVKLAAEAEIDIVAGNALDGVFRCLAADLTPGSHCLMPHRRRDRSRTWRASTPHAAWPSRPTLRRRSMCVTRLR